MNNSSDSENINNNDNDNNDTNTMKKRGRPRKNLFLDKSTKNSDKKEITNEEKDIILHLPVFMPKTKKKEYENELDSEIDSDNDETVLSISDEDSDESEYDYKKLYKEQLALNNKKDMYIEKLKQSGVKTSEIFDSDVQKDLIKHTIQLKLIDNNTMKIIEQHRTDICCWWCTYSFDTYACFIPEKFYNDTYYVFGCFCSFNCAAS
jgi:hypothetical protein